MHLVVKRSDLIIQVSDDIFIFMSGLELKLNWTHVEEASGEKEVEELNCGAILCLEIVGGCQRVDNLAVYKLCL